MAAGPFILYDIAALDIGGGAVPHDFDTHAFKIALVTSSYTWSPAHSLYANITNELTTANGYTIGGGLLTGVTWTRTAGVAKFTSNNFVWTASGAGITARRAILYNDTQSGKPLLGSYLLDATPADLTATAGNTFTVGPHATNGWFQQTVNPV